MAVSDSVLSQTIRIAGHGGDEIEAYQALPSQNGGHGGVVVIHHMPGYDRATKEIVRRFAELGYNAVCPNLYWREAPGAAPDDAAATARAQGGVPDERLVGDVSGAAAHLRSLSGANGRIGSSDIARTVASRCWPPAAASSTRRWTATARLSWARRLKASRSR